MIEISSMIGDIRESIEIEYDIDPCERIKFVIRFDSIIKDIEKRGYFLFTASRHITFDESKAVLKSAMIIIKKQSSDDIFKMNEPI